MNRKEKKEVLIPRYSRQQAIRAIVRNKLQRLREDKGKDEQSMRDRGRILQQEHMNLGKEKWKQARTRDRSKRETEYGPRTKLQRTTEGRSEEQRPGTGQQREIKKQWTAKARADDTGWRWRKHSSK